MVRLLAIVGDQWRIAVDVKPANPRRVFELLLPRDATDSELDDFIGQVRGILRKRRATDQTPEPEGT